VLVRQVKPIGTHPEFFRLMERRITRILRTFALDAAQTTVAIVGHGTSRHHRSRSATVDVVDVLRGRDLCAEIIEAFLDDDPRINTILDRANNPNVVIVPFLISNGPHATEDVPRAVGMNPSGDAEWPLASRSNGRVVICDEAVGTDPGIVPLIVSIAREYR
jgi:sirohydrochlorin cobaltochelatase